MRGMKRPPKVSRGRPPVTALPTGPAPADASGPWVQLQAWTWHALVYRRMIGCVAPGVQAGQIVDVFDKQGAFMARGLFHPTSQIAVRILTRQREEIDEGFWTQRLAAAVALRERLNIEADSDAYRLVHAEGDGLSGLIAERLGDCIVCEIFSAGIARRIDLLAPLLAECLGPPRRLERPHEVGKNWRVFLRADEKIMRIERFRLPEQETPGPLVIREHGIRYRVDVQAGHKTGFFCDQRENRLRLSRYCRDAEVLDLCCYSGGFGLAAHCLGKARKVTSVDLDEHAVALARDNANLNQARIQTVQADAFIYLRQLIADGRQFDVVVLDPPKFCPTRGDLEDGIRKYRDLNRLALQVVRVGGILLSCSCSGLVQADEFRKLVLQAARPAGVTLQLLEQSGPGPDHPVMPDCPESSYLKAVWVRVTGRLPVPGGERSTPDEAD